MENFFIFLGLGSLFIFLVYCSLSWWKWRNTLKIRKKLNDEEFAIFNEVKFQSTVYGSLKIVTSIEILADIYMNDLQIIILPNRYSLKIFNSEVPKILSVNKLKCNFETFYSKSILIKIDNYPYRFGELKAEFTFTFLNVEMRNESYNYIKKFQNINHEQSK